MTLTAHEILVKPIVTEKNTMLSESGRYAFEVDVRANKIQIRQAIQEVFNVEVTAVNIIRVPGKVKRVVRGRRRVKQIAGRTRSWKKAVVSLKEGQRIELFQGV
ncbi:MAG: 50S ribosomal protein L23 [Chloroflexi bacterium]|nr:50S ribosomal protein L23 [Chloroflexota bacterium]